MRIAEVIGTVTLSRMHPSVTGARWVIGVPFSLTALREARPHGDGEALVIFDELGAGRGHRIGVIGKNKQLMNVLSEELWTEWPAAVAEMELWNGGGIYDYIFEDTADSIYNTTASPCNFDQQTWTDDTNNMDTILSMPIFYNGLSHVGTTGNPAPVIQINPTTKGGEGEECYIGRTPTGYHYEQFWIGMANTEITMQRQNRLFDCTGTASGDAAKNAALRTYQYASFLLTYDLNSSIMESRWTTPSGVSVMPETLLVPEDPLVQTPSNISGLLESSGVYGREYGSCYLGGTLVGACAVAVNSNNPKAKAPLAYPWPGKYNHTLTTSGEDLYDGGTVGTNGPAPPAQMAGGTAVIAFP